MTIKLAENLQILRKQKKITQEELASIFGVTSQSISKWELGLSCPDITLLPKIAEFYSVTIDELLGYKASSSINDIYIQINSYLNTIQDDGERIDTIYRINRLAGAATTKHESNTVKNLINGKYGNNSSILQTYGKEHGGVLTHDINSILVSSFKDFPILTTSKIRELYKSLSKLCNMNVLKVLVTLFEYNNYSLEKNGMTVKEIASKCDLTIDDVYEAMNNLDVKLNEYENEERWILMHTDTLPLLMLLNQGTNFFKNGE